MYSLAYCELQSCKWVFDGPAYNFIRHLMNWYHSSSDGRQDTEQIFENIRKKRWE
jgi:hypothetical protein